MEADAVTRRSHDMPIMVCSHKRSGTHLFMALIWNNLVIPNSCSNAIVHSGKMFSTGGVTCGPGGRVVVPWGRLWKSHSKFNLAWVESGEVDRIVYIVRHPVRCITSYVRFVRPHEQAVDERFVELVSKNWTTHVTSYIGKCHITRYEDLIGPEAEREINKIAERLSLERQDVRFRTVDNPVGWFADFDRLDVVEIMEASKRAVKKNVPRELMKLLKYDMEG